MNDAVVPQGTARASSAGFFHAGELQAQALAGFSSSATAIREYMPEQHRSFFEALKFVLLATIDETGAPVATVVANAQGVLLSPDDRSLRLRSAIDANDPVLSRLHRESAVGMLGIDFRTRRRNRANGVIRSIAETYIDIDVLQSFGNCPKYIHVRDVNVNPREPDRMIAAHALTSLDAVASSTILSASTMFVATASGNDVMAGGVDISHRGGEPGFVKIEGDTLLMPDYLGNRYFNTLGNMLLEPRAALLIIDFRNGDLLHLQGRVEIQWQSTRLAEFNGAERLWCFHVEKGSRRAMGQLTARESA